MLATQNVKYAAEVGITLPMPFEPAKDWLGRRMLTPAWAFAASRTEIVETARDFEDGRARIRISYMRSTWSQVVTRDRGGPHSQFHRALLPAIEEWLSEHG
jgi:hypothetical protein